MKSRMVRLWRTWRTYTVLIAAVLLNLKLFGWSYRSVCVPGMNCHGCPAASGACPVGALAYGLSVKTLPLVAVASMLAVGVVFGRLICGAVCPFGLLQDFIHRLPGPILRLPQWLRYGKYAVLLLFILVLPWWWGMDHGAFVRLPAPEINADPAGLRVAASIENLSTHPIEGVQIDAVYRDDELREIERIPLAIGAVAVPPQQTRALEEVVIPNRIDEATLYLESPQGQPQPQGGWFYYCTWCPVGGVESRLPGLAALGAVQGWGAVWAILSGAPVVYTVLVVSLLLMWLYSRFYCRVLCPVGAVYGLCTPLALSRLQIDERFCTHCGACSRVCPIELDVPKEVGGAECIACGDCLRACPQGGIRRVVGFDRAPARSSGPA